MAENRKDQEVQGNQSDHSDKSLPKKETKKSGNNNNQNNTSERQETTWDYVTRNPVMFFPFLN